MEPLRTPKTQIRRLLFKPIINHFTTPLLVSLSLSGSLSLCLSLSHRPKETKTLTKRERETKPKSHKT
nr:hypothetical protein CFP56_45589 [Quercus suber]